MDDLVTVGPSAVLARYLAPAVPDPAQRHAAAVALLSGPTAAVAWARGARTYEGGAYPDRASAQREAGSAPVSHFLTFTTRYVGEAELAPGRTAREDAAAVLGLLLGGVVRHPSERAAVTRLLLVRHVGAEPRLGSWTVGWGSGPPGSEDGNGPYAVAAKYAEGQPLARRVDIRTRHIHDDEAPP